MNPVNTQLLAVTFVPAVIVLTVILVRWKNARTRRFVESWLTESGIDATVTGRWMLPIRLWLSNRKGDGWCHVEMQDGQTKWVRVRSRLFSGTSVDFFD